MTNKINPSIEGYAVAARAFEPHLYVAAFMRLEDAREAQSKAWGALNGLEGEALEAAAMRASQAATELWEAMEGLEAFGA